MSRIVLAPHQLEAVALLIERLDHMGGSLLADEVGMGKSWVAASVAREFLRRGDPVEVIVPRSIVEQWRQLLAMFDVSAEIVTHDSLRGSFSFPGVGPRLLVIDEAHRFRNPTTLRHRALALRCVGSRVLLVTATPICNRVDDLMSLIGLICPDDGLRSEGVGSISHAFEQAMAEQTARILSTLVVRRGRDALPSTLRFGEVRRDVIRFRVTPNQESIRKALVALRFPCIAGTGGQAALLQRLLWHRFESGIEALRESLRRQKRFYRRAIESLKHGVRLSKPEYRRIFGPDEDEVHFQDLLFHDLWAIGGIPRDDSLSELEAELRRLDAIELLLKEPDEKMSRLIELVRTSSPELMLVFTGAVATARELFRVCSQWAPTALLSSRLQWCGRLRNLTVEQVLDSFRRGETRVLVMTDVGAEGLNLQSAGMVIHYDLPWNPVRVEQRNGRIQRIGQRRDRIRAVYFVPRREADRVVIRRVSAKNRVRRAFLDDHARDQTSGLPVPFFLRPRLRRGDPQLLLHARLQSLRLLNEVLAGLLMRRYRAGVEIIMREMAGEFLDAARRDYLEEVLRGELELTGLERKSRASAASERTPSGSARSSTKYNGE